MLPIIKRARTEARIFLTEIEYKELLRQARIKTIKQLDLNPHFYLQRQRCSYECQGDTGRAQYVESGGREK